LGTTDLELQQKALYTGSLVGKSKHTIHTKHATNLPTKARIFQKQCNWQIAYY